MRQPTTRSGRSSSRRLERGLPEQDETSSLPWWMSPIACKGIITRRYSGARAPARPWLGLRRDLRHHRRRQARRRAQRRAWRRHAGWCRCGVLHARARQRARWRARRLARGGNRRASGAPASSSSTASGSRELDPRCHSSCSRSATPRSAHGGSKSAWCPTRAGEAPGSAWSAWEATEVTTLKSVTIYLTPACNRPRGDGRSTLSAGEP